MHSGPKENKTVKYMILRCYKNLKYARNSPGSSFIGMQKKGDNFNFSSKTHLIKGEFLAVNLYMGGGLWPYF